MVVKKLQGTSHMVFVQKFTQFDDQKSKIKYQIKCGLNHWIFLDKLFLEGTSKIRTTILPENSLDRQLWLSMELKQQEIR